MKKTFTTLALLLLLSLTSIYANESNIKETEVTLTTSSGEINGILRNPTNETKTVAIIISGAPRTDRDGNQPQTKNNSLKMLAEELTQNGIAVLNFDKRGVGQSQQAGANEAKITLDTYVTDAKEWINLLKEEYKYDNIIVIGHGEGSLIATLASIENTNVNKLIALAATSKKAADAAREQLKNLPATIKNTVYGYIDKLEAGESIPNVPQEWSVLFRSSMQPYLISLYKHNPIDEIAKIEVPILIIQGDKDVQASVEDAELLANANINANKVIIENMNYVLKECEKEGQENQLPIYLRPDFPLNKEIVPAIINFIQPKE